ncbi:MAG: 6-carboxytetrahydropterin synthase [Candidatus Nitrosocaldus sp.]|nr:6-carboxytetrahydropterin synthase [Candidatus Nitrosocaldus sp.]MCS7140677.1 6-carboxytetrahydropterin synthase [Candidatus Nitrosocaldus sp.]MDW7999508.1 6-carboxytetrahydropterin synthase [Candidatus Nitrosocaldus sp.]MDW8275096.1 6-carboxytetrahydropterin synthase [Candidatus Nitrosocaldus sp.]
MLADRHVRYVDGKGNLLRSRNEMTVAELLRFLNIDYEYDAMLALDDGSSISIDFRTEHGYIEVVDDASDLEKLRRLRRSGRRVIGVGKALSAASMDELDSISTYGDGEYAALVFEDPSLSFDYSHILPLVNKCSVLHGHTASVVIELMGVKDEKSDMIIDFGEAKRLIKQALNALDHKFFISRKYLVEEDELHYRVAFDGPNGRFDLRVPKHTTYLFEGEATAENLAKEIIALVAARMPENVKAIGVYIYEGVSKGAHVVSRIGDGYSRSGSDEGTGSGG